MRGRLAALAFCAVAAAAAWVAPARADDDPLLTGTLKTINQRGTILIGYRDGAVPFSFRNKGGQPVGFSLDLCRGIAADVARTLNRDLVEPDAPAWQTGVRIVLVPVPADARLPMMVSGAVDLECGSTTATAERAKTVAFSPIFFLAGAKLMVAKSGGATSYRDLAGRTIAVSAGTTTDDVLRRLAGNTNPPLKLAETAGLDAAYDMLVAGKADAFASDDILLYGYAASKPEGQRFRIVGDYLSFEPYAIILRRDDDAFAALVRQSFERMAAAGMLSSSYNRWFIDKLPNGETLNLPMSPQLTEMYRALGQPD